MPADALATLGARASTGIVLTLLIQNILYLASEKLKYYTYHNSVKTTYNMHHRDGYVQILRQNTE